MTFAIDFTLPFADAIKAAKRRGVALPDAYYADLQRMAQANTFTVSGLTALDQVQSVIDRVTAHLEAGGTLATFQQWAATQNFGLPAHRMETVYRNAIQNAYNAGHWRRFEENKRHSPYLMYDAINDGRTRPAHRAMDGLIRPVDDPIWLRISPPNGHRCRCRLVSLSADQAQARSRDGRGLNMPITPEMHADAGGWGGKPTAWGEVLEAVKAKKLGKVSTRIVDAAKMLTSTTMMPPIPRAMLDGLIERRIKSDEDGFSALWAQKVSLDRHLRRRISRGEVSNAEEYESRTLAVFAQAATLTVVTPTNEAMRHTGRMALVSGEWIVLLSEDGGIVTSYPMIPELMSFEDRHAELGDRIDEYPIGDDYRTRLADIFG